MIDGVFYLAPVHINSFLTDVFDFIFPGNRQFPDGSDYLNIGSHHLEYQIEPHLVITGSGGAMGYMTKAVFLCMVHKSNGLESSFRAYRQWVAPVPQHIAKDHIPQTPVIVIGCYIKYPMGNNTQPLCMPFDLLQLLCLEPTRIYNGRMYFHLFLLCKVYGTKRCVQSPAEGQ